MASMGYKVGDVMDEADYQLPVLNLDVVFKQILVVGGMLGDETLDKAQVSLWSIKDAMPFVKELTERVPILIDTAIDALQEAARIRGLPVVTRADMTEDAGEDLDPLQCTCHETNNDGTCPYCYPNHIKPDQVDDVDVDDPKGAQ